MTDPADKLAEAARAIFSYEETCGPSCTEWDRYYEGLRSALAAYDAAKDVREADGEEFADKLVDWVATTTQLDPEKGELANVEDWRRNAKELFDLFAARKALEESHGK